jgi:hypothetical protein
VESAHKSAACLLQGSQEQVRPSGQVAEGRSVQPSPLPPQPQPQLRPQLHHGEWGAAEGPESPTRAELTEVVPAPDPAPGPAQTSDGNSDPDMADSAAAAARSGARLGEGQGRGEAGDHSPPGGGPSPNTLEALVDGLVGNGAAEGAGISADLVGQFWWAYGRMSEAELRNARKLQGWLERGQYEVARAYMGSVVRSKS